jgi:inhibitor of KinA sporulation pathway (predicted exonuclease)
MDLKLNPEDPVHRQFVDWISDLEESCKGPWDHELKKSSTIYNNGIRFMFFSDTNVFDSKNMLSAEFMKAKSLSAIISLVGLWTSADKYGLKFNIVQFKFFEDAIPYPEIEEPIKHDKLMFVDD